MSCLLRALIIADLSDRQNDPPFTQEESEAQRDHLTSTLIGALSWVTMERSSFPWANWMPLSLAALASLAGCPRDVFSSALATETRLSVGRCCPGEFMLNRHR